MSGAGVGAPFGISNLPGEKSLPSDPSAPSGALPQPALLHGAVPDPPQAMGDPTPYPTDGDPEPSSSTGVASAPDPPSQGLGFGFGFQLLPLDVPLPPSFVTAAALEAGEVYVGAMERLSCVCVRVRVCPCVVGTMCVWPCASARWVCICECPCVHAYPCVCRGVTACAMRHCMRVCGVRACQPAS